MIKRYVGIEVHEAPDGDMIDYEDHLAAIENLERVHRNEINELRWMNGLVRDDLIEEIKTLYRNSDGDFDFVIWSLEKNGDSH
jgi:hypothetical protein